MQYAPTFSFLVLDFTGVEAKHNFRNRLFTGAVSHLIMATVVYTMKSKIAVKRPNERGLNSFPSGHTATAFVGAELLWQEYRHHSPWYGIAGYTSAAATGFFRMYNNKHWLSDIAMGAGLGILSAKAAYWLLPLVESNLSSKGKSYVVYPSYDGQYASLSVHISL